jgi:hypothetical protein
MKTAEFKKIIGGKESNDILSAKSMYKDLNLSVIILHQC